MRVRAALQALLLCAAGMSADSAALHECTVWPTTHGCDLHTCLLQTRVSPPACLALDTHWWARRVQDRQAPPGGWNWCER